MQRNDLTIYEQAQGFQMMLDLGETEESIAEKTGFSRTTIRRRLNIAKLDQEELKKKEQNESFQLTLKDLYVLEELKDVEERNKILREATNSLVLQSKVSQRKAELTREENAKKLIKELEEMGVTKAPEEYLGSMYSGKWTTVKNISLDETTPKIPHIKEVEGCFYYKSFRSIQVFRKNTKTEKTETEYERKRKEEDRKKTEIQNIAKEMEMQRADFIRNLLCGNSEPWKDVEKKVKKLWNFMATAEAMVERESLARFLANTEKKWWQMEDSEKEAALNKLDEISIIHQMIITAYIATEDLTFIDYYLHYDEDDGNIIKEFTEFLNEYGFSYSDNEMYEVMNGTHENYKKEDA